VTTNLDTTADNDVEFLDAEVCTKQEAEQLVADAVSHANGLLDNMHDIYRRKAWIPLGFHTVGDLMKSPMIAEKILNPMTGAPYSRQHLHRIATAANLQNAIAVAAGVDIADITVDEKKLRELKAAGVADVERDVVEEIVRRRDTAAAPRGGDVDEADAGEVPGDPDEASAPASAEESAPMSAQEVQGIVNHRLAGGDAADAPHPADEDMSATADDADTADDDADGSLDAADEEAIEAAARQSRSQDAPQNTPAGDSTAGFSATAAFDEAMSDGDGEEPERRGSRAPESTVTMADALSAARVYGETTSAATRIENLGSDLERTIKTMSSAVSKAREVLSTVFTTGASGRRLVEAENKAETLSSSLSEEERSSLADRLDDVAALAPTVEAVSKICREVSSRAEVAQITSMLNLMEVTVTEADDVSRACGALAAALRGDDDGKESVDDILADLGL
jgi:hypothetical protein